MQQSEEELNVTTFDIYLHLVRLGEPEGPRDVMRAMGIGSSGVVHRHLQKLLDWGWVSKDEYGRYMAKRKVGFSGYVWLGRRLFPRSILFAFVFAGLTVFWLVVLFLHLWLGSGVEESFSVLTVVTAFAAVFFLVEALRPSRRLPKLPVEG